jgi:dinuclear metal center YbgI/SA1388 family protein
MANQVKDIAAILDHHYPPYLAASWDNCGLQLGSYSAPVKKVGVALDLEPEVVEAAIGLRVDMIITHHPLFFQGLKRLEADMPQGKTIYKLINAGISVYSAHTNLDAASQGLNQHLAEMLQLQDIQPLTVDRQDELYKVVVYVPCEHVKAVQTAMAEAGAGHIGKYSACSFRTPGIGSFCPEEGSQPFIGSVGILEEVEEYRLETVIEHNGLQRVLQAMHSAHPYEEVAYDVYRLVNGGRIYSMGRKGKLPQPCSLESLAERVKTVFHCPGVRIAGNRRQMIQRVAVISGSGGSVLTRIDPWQAEAVITGDVKYHEAQEARLKGLNLIDAGHQELERHMIPLVCDLLADESKRWGLSLEVIELNASPCFTIY